MLALRTVEPDGLVVRNADSVRQKLGCRVHRCRCWHEAGEESVCLVGHDVLNRYARIVEGRLNDRVVLLNVR